MKKLTTILGIAAVAATTATAAFAAPVDVREARAEAKATAGAASEKASPGRPPAASPSIVDIAVAVSGGASAGQPDGNMNDFDTLVSLVVQYPDILSALSSKGQYTVFAPTDAAFAALFAVVDPSTLTAAQIKNILLFHVAHGSRDAADVTSSTQIRMLNGDFAAVSGATIDGANIVAVNIFASNGVIHVVDKVLLP